MMDMQIDGLNIRCQIVGEGTPVVLLHGWGAAIQSWGGMPAALAERHRVLALDFPGHGGSEEPRTPWEVSDFVNLVLRVLDHFQIRECDLIGHSFGGRVCIKLAAGYPERVKRLVLCDAAGVLPKRTLKYHVRVKSYKALKAAARSAGVRRVCKAFGLDVEQRVKNAGSEDYRRLSEGMKRTFVKVVNEDLTPFLKQIKAPALLYWGENDTETPLYQAHIMEREIPDAALITVPGGGHYSYLDDYTRFLRVISVFLGG